MTEKRFIKGYHNIRDTKENKTYDFRVDIICGLLNEVNDENENLKTLNTHLKNEMSWIKDCAYWREKEAFNKLFGNYMVTVDEYRIMLKENQYLKELLMDCCEVDECEIENELKRMKSE